VQAVGFGPTHDPRGGVEKENYMPQYTVLIYASNSVHAVDATADDTVVAGFYVLEAPDVDTAVAIASTNDVISHGGGVEVRPVHSGGMVSYA
jgi:hypothetical protein